LIAADSSVLVDLLSGQGAEAEAAGDSLRQALHIGPVVLCEVALAEVCTSVQGGAMLQAYRQHAAERAALGIPPAAARREADRPS
jgi:predicted nucleic acid-binding protein